MANDLGAWRPLPLPLTSKGVVSVDSEGMTGSCGVFEMIGRKDGGKGMRVFECQVESSLDLHRQWIQCHSLNKNAD